MATIVDTAQVVNKRKTMRTSVQDPALVKLIHRTALKEQRAFEELYKATSPYAFSLLRRMLYSDTLAEEALQEVFVNVWKKSKNYNSDEIEPKTWILDIARQSAIAELRKSETNVNAQASPDLPARVARSNLDGIEIQTSELSKGFSILNDTNRGFIALAYCEGFSYEELSQKTQKPEKTIKSWIRKSLLCLKEHKDEH